ncbi:alcohol dehydrogenase-like domain-containing protein [Apiospora marii]|uniref:Alcohol dehydrogenase-like domain-containing protein n=1 Tax=Apiospora marii TaxID=335849 RepID=A0ABR1SHT8_9PEZI
MATEYTSRGTMRAVLFEGKPFEMVVRDVPKPKIQMPEDAIIRVTASAICGTDLHTYHGQLGSSEVPWIMGHEAVGVVVEVGSGTEFFQVGDRVVIACIPDDGHLASQPTVVPSLTCLGLGKDFGDVDGTQAEYVRVPYADDSLIKIETQNSHDDLNYLFLFDILVTGWQCLDFAGFQAGDAVAVFGGGPVGLLCAHSALLRGASKVFVVDHVPARLAKARSIGAVPIDFTKEDGDKKLGAADQILALHPEGVMRCCDCVGYESLNPELKPQPDYVTKEMVKVASVGGGIGVVGVWGKIPASKGAPNADSLPSTVDFPVADFWFKGLSYKGGAADIVGLSPKILQLVETGRAQPDFIISSEVGIEDVPEAYSRFDKKLETKVVIRLPWEWQSHNRAGEASPRQQNDSSDTPNAVVGPQHP